MFDFLIISLVITIILFSIYNSKNIINLIILSGYFFLLFFIFNKINSIYKFDGIGSSFLSIFLLSLLVYLFYFDKQKLEKIRIKKIYFLISLFFVIFYSHKYFLSIDTITWFSNGDDWEIFQVLGRLIAVDNVWVFEDERATIRRYGIRFVVAILHTLFGKTFILNNYLKSGQ